MVLFPSVGPAPISTLPDITTETSHADALPLSSTAAEPADLAAMSALPRLVDCALRFVNRQARAKGAPRCLPFSCTEEQLPLLLQAVQQRVRADTAAAAAAAISPLCISDQQLVRSLMTQLQQWPDVMQQLWVAMSARKLSKEQVSMHTRAHPRCEGIYRIRSRAYCALHPLCFNRSDSCMSRLLSMITFAMWRCNIVRASAARYG